MDHHSNHLADLIHVPRPADRETRYKGATGNWETRLKSKGDGM